MCYHYALWIIARTRPWIMIVSSGRMMFIFLRNIHTRHPIIHPKCSQRGRVIRHLLWGHVLNNVIHTLSFSCSIMTSSNGNIFRVTGPLCGEFTGHRWIPRTNASDAELWCFLWTNDWVNNRHTDDLRRHCACYDVTVMIYHDTFFYGIDWCVEVRVLF